MVKDKAAKKDQDKNFDKKWAKLLPSGYEESAQSMQNPELEQVIVKSRGLIGDIEIDLRNDNKLKVLKDDIKTIVGAYHDAQKAEDAKVRFALHLLRERGAR